MIDIALTATCLLILTWQMFGYYDIQRMNNKSNVTVVLWQVDHISNLSPSALPLSNVNLDSIDASNIDYRKLIAELANHFIVLNNSFVKTTDNVYANILMVREPETNRPSEKNIIKPISNNRIEDINNQDNFVREVEIPTIQLKRVAVIELLVEDDIPPILKFLQYFSQPEITSIKKYLDYTSRDDSTVSYEGIGSDQHEVTSGWISSSIQNLTVLSSLIILTCIVIWGKRHYLHKKNLFSKSDQYISAKMSTMKKSMNKAEILQKCRIEKMQSKRERNVIEKMRLQFIELQNSVAHKITDEEKVMELKHQCGVYEQSVQKILQLIRRLEKRQQECLKIDNSVTEFLEENVKQLKWTILNEDAATFDRDRYTANLADAIAKFEDRYNLEEDPAIKTRYEDQVTSLKETLNQLQLKQTSQDQAPVRNKNCDSLPVEDLTSLPVFSPVINLNTDIQYSSKMDKKNPGIKASQESLMKSVMGDKWVDEEIDSNLTDDVSQSPLRWIGGIWYQDGKKLYSLPFTKSTSSTSQSAPELTNGDGLPQLLEDTLAEDYIGSSGIANNSIV